MKFINTIKKGDKITSSSSGGVIVTSSSGGVSIDENDKSKWNVDDGVLYPKNNENKISIGEITKTLKIQGDLLPKLDFTYDLGGQFEKWKTIYADNANISSISTSLLNHYLSLDLYHNDEKIGSLTDTLNLNKIQPYSDDLSFIGQANNPYDEGYFKELNVSNNLYTRDLDAQEATITKLVVKGSMDVFSLNIDEVNVTKGQTIVSPYHAELVKVDTTTTRIICYFKAEEETTKLNNPFVANDMVIYQNFNLSNGSRFYYGRVASVATTIYYYDTIQDLIVDTPNENTIKTMRVQLYNWNVSTYNKDTYRHPATNSMPQKGDILAVLGNTNNVYTERQNAIVISSIDSTYLIPKYKKGNAWVDILSPSIVSYKGINSFIQTIDGVTHSGLDNKQDTIISKELNIFNGEFVSQTADGTRLEITNGKIINKAGTWEIHDSEDNTTAFIDDGGNINAQGFMLLQDNDITDNLIVRSDDVPYGHISDGTIANHYDLDLMKCGNIININQQPDGNTAIYLPYYISPTKAQVTKTNYITNTPHKITSDNIRQLLGRKFYIVNRLNTQTYFYKIVMNGTPTQFYADDNIGDWSCYDFNPQVAMMVGRNSTITLELKLIWKKRNNMYQPAYAWSYGFGDGTEIINFIENFEG